MYGFHSENNCIDIYPFDKEDRDLLSKGIERDQWLEMC